VLAAVGGVLGVALAAFALRGFVALDPPGLPRVEALRIDGAVLAFALGLTGLATVLFSLAPLAVRRAGMAASLRESSRSVSGGPRADRVRPALGRGPPGSAPVPLWR